MAARNGFDDQHLKEYRAKPRGQCFTETQRSRNDEMMDAIKLRDQNFVLDEIPPASAIKALMVCPNCGKLPIPPISICIKGHILCNDCAIKVHGCTYVPANTFDFGMCGARTIPFEIQLYKHLVDNSSLYCPYTDLGCTEKVNGSAMATHLEVCMYRDSIRCPCSDCGKIRISPRMYLEHLNVDHNAQMLEGPTHKVQVYHVRKALYSALCGDYRWVNAIISYGGLDFLFVIQETDKEMFMWLHLVNHEQAMIDGQEYLVKFSLTNPRTKRMDYMWAGEIAPKTQPMDLIVNPRSQYCFYVPKMRFEKEFLFQIPDENDDKKYYYNLDLTILPMINTDE